MPRIKTAAIPSVCVLLVFCLAATGRAAVYYVDSDSPNDGPGYDWAHAFHYLQNALAMGSGNELRVAEGAYRPDETSANPTGTGARTATFQLMTGVALYGGYAGYGQPDPDEHDVATHETTLSGDLNGDDGPAFVPDFAACFSGPGVPYEPGCGPLDSDGDGDVDGGDRVLFLAANNYGENSYRVTTGGGANATARLDGFTITAGNADSFPNDHVGGGMYNLGGSPTLAYCTFDGNSAVYYGAGMYNSSGNPALTDCTFSGNVAGNRGGGMYNYVSSPALADCTFSGNCATAQYGGGMGNDYYSSPNLTRCTFSNNSVGDRGGGMLCITNCNPTLTDCAFTDNSALMGGGMYNFSQSSPTLTNCTFDGNSADFGGGMDNSQSSPALTDCTFIGNSSAGLAGGMRNGDMSNPTLVNCIFSGNSANYGGGMLDYSSSNPTLTNCTFGGNSAALDAGGIYNTSGNPRLTNCILWGNSDSGGTDESAQIFTSAGTPVVNYSCVKGGWTGAGGTGNIASDPLFVRNPDPGPDGNWDGLDDDYGDLHLQAGSLGINAGDNNADTDQSLPGVQPLPDTDLDGNPRIVNAIVDLGAYENQECTCGDLNGDGFVDLNDFATFATCFALDLPALDCDPREFACSDLTGSGRIDLDDFATFAVMFATAPTTTVPNCVP